MTAKGRTARFHLPLSGFSFGLKRTLFVLSGVLVRRVIDFGRAAGFDNLMLYSLSVCNLASAFCVPVGARILGGTQRRCFLFCPTTHDARLYRYNCVASALYTDALLFSTPVRRRNFLRLFICPELRPSFRVVILSLR